MYIAKGCWKRKVVQHPDERKGDVNNILSSHPYSVANTPEFALIYAQLYGQEELDILKRSCTGSRFNMVESVTKEWVLGGTFVPRDPKPEEVLKEGYMWQGNPFATGGRIQVPIGTSTVNPPVAITELSADVRKEINAIVYDAVMKALVAWSAV